MPDDPTFAWRAPLGVLALVALAMRDRFRTGTWNRARELGFLFGTTAVAVLFAIAHDAITWTVCRDYFVVGKDVPAAATSFAPVARLAALAGWSAGLAIGLVLVVANNPRPSLPQLPYDALARELARVGLAAVVTALVGAAVLPLASDALAPVLDEAGIADASPFLVAQGAHAGTYVGALLGAVRAWRWIRRERRSSAGRDARIAPLA